MRKKSILYFFLALGAVCVLSCKKNKTVSVSCDGTASTYDTNIRGIINSNCTSSGCHPNYTSYSAIKTVLDNGSFKNRVLTKQDMPRNGDLSTSQLSQIQCWVDAGYPEK